MENFCGSKFWDANVTWDTETPDFTPCFEKTTLAWTACAFLWLAGTCQLFLLIRPSSRRAHPTTFLNAFQQLITAASIAIEILSFAYTFRKSRRREHRIYPVDRVTPAIKVVTFIFAFLLQFLSKRRGIASSGVLFIFWFLEAFFGAFRFQTAIRHFSNTQDDYQRLRFILLMVSFPIVVAQFLSHFFADIPADKRRQNNLPGVPEGKASSSAYPCPEKLISFPSRITFQWFWPMAVLGFKKPLQLEDLWDLNPEDKSKVQVEKFHKLWRREQDAMNKVKDQEGTKVGDGIEAIPKKNRISIVPLLWQCNRKTVILGATSKVISDLLIFVSPRILDLLIAHVESDEERWKGYFFAALLYINVSVQVLFLGQYFRNNFVTGMRVRTTLIGAVYKKALVISNAARKQSTVGEIVNLMSVDAQKLADSPMFLQILWSSPIQVTMAIFFLWTTLGPSIIAGVIVLLTLIPTNILILRKVKKLQVKQMKLKDRRVKLMSEILSGMKVLKLYAWELFFEEQVHQIRREEMKFLRTEAFLNSLSSFIWFIAPFLVSLVTFATYVLIDERNILDARKAFVSLTYFNILRMPMQILPNALVSIMQAVVSIKRLNGFMNSEEIDTSAITHAESTDGAPITLDNGTFAWSDDIVLRNIKLKVPKGSLIAIIGPVGSGKSSFLSAILGEMDKVSGNVNTVGSIAYVAQQAWIQNATLRDNILFGKEFNEQKYDTVLEACALKPDLRILPGGDRTEIGEMGINLSGGQKQRVALARALYHNADIYLLDDPLSAVDSHVGKHLFEKAIGPKGLLRTKTRLVVTHSVAYLPRMDQIVVMNQGEIVESGTFSELMEKKGAFAEFVSQHSTKEDDGRAAQRAADNPESAFTDHPNFDVISTDTNSKIEMSRSFSDSSTPAEDAGLNENLITVEKAETGNVKSNVYQYFIESFSTKRAILALVLYIVLHGLSLLSSVWLGEWSNVDAINGTQDATKRDLYLGVYGGYGLGQALASFASNVVLALGCLRASGLLHNNMLKRIMRAPMSFFDTTPLGRIVNRFSRDVDVMDNNFPGNLRSFITYLFQVLSTLIVISYSVPLFLLVVLPIGVMYYAVQRFYIASSRQLKRLESLTRSPIYSHFGETLTGTTTIRAFAVQRQFIEKSERAVDCNQRTYYPSIIANRWVGFNLETLGNLIVLFAALLAVLSNRDESSLGLSVSYALSITQALKWLVRISADVEMNVVSVERLKEYGEVEQEAAWDVPDKRPPMNWPERGEIKFLKYQTRYREGLDLVLKGITCSVLPGEKLGIVGRTGAGKSSLTLGLFRIIEAAAGAIEIDGQTLAHLGLHDVRGRLTIIPQDPVLFAGSLRMNLDPAEKYSDHDIWLALRHAHLSLFAKSLSKGLEHEISEGGGNLSVGQRQLICLARALLRKTRILILDEATAAVDLETDDLIQQTIRTEFKECTVVTIAHRLNTILDYDRVMVMDKGEIKEFDDPQELLADGNSTFFSMAKDAGLV